MKIDNKENIIANISEVEGASGEKLDELVQVLAKLKGADKDGNLTIGPDAQDSTVNIKYKLGEVVKNTDDENKANEGIIDENDITEVNGDWQEYTGDLTISKNSTLYAKATKNENDSEISFKIINNIDTEKPGITNITKTGISEEDNREVKITAQITDDASGLAKYGISRSETDEPNSYIIADSDLTDEDISIHRNASPELSKDMEIDGICENGDYYIWVWDSAGNCVVQQVNVTEVKEVNVAKIVKTDINADTLVGKEYTSLYKAIEASPENSNTEIEIIAEIYNENNQISNKNITINLNGKKVNNRDINEPTLTVNEDASLTIINESEDKTTSIMVGSLESQNTAAILVKKGATLTIRKR